MTRLVGLLLLAALLGAGGWWLLRGELFALRRVETGAYRFTDAARLEERLGTLLGRNIWTVGREEVAAAVADLPWVRDVRVSRRLPAALRVELAEWRPLLALAGRRETTRPRVLVGDGRVLAFPAGLPAPVLPVLAGVPAPPDSLGVARVAPSTWAQLADLLAALAATGLESVAPVDFVVAEDRGYAIVLADGGGRLLVGRKDFRRRLERYLTARDHLAPELEVDLRFRDRVTVRRPEGS